MFEAPEEKGFVVENPGNSKRNNLISLTELGESTIAIGLDPWKKAQKQIRETVGFDNLDEFVQTLKRLENCLD